MGHTFCAVSRNIAYRNTSGPCSFNIDIVVSCSGLTDQLNRIRKTGNCIAVNGHLLRHNNIHPLHTFKNLILLSGGFSRKFVLRLCLTSFCICGMVVFLSFSTGLERSLL